MINALSKDTIITEYYKVHREEMVLFVAKRIGRSDLAEDMVHDAFLKLLLTDKMITAVTIQKIIYIILRNIMFDYWRRHRVIEEYEHYIKKHSSMTGLTTESVYSIKEVVNLLEKGVARLTGRQREIYCLNVYQGMKVAEISTILHVEYKSVENHLGVARKKIRKYIKMRLAI